MRGGRGFGFNAGPGTGRTSIGGGNGATCWVMTGAAGGTADAGAVTLGFGAIRRGSRPGTGTSDTGGSGSFIAGEAPGGGCGRVGGGGGAGEGGGAGAP